MGWTKRQFISAAFDEIGLADYVFDLSPDQIQASLVRLDAVVARLKLDIHWPFGYNLDTDTRCPDYANEAIFLNLAVAIAPSHGKQLSQITINNANNAFDFVTTYSSSLPPTRQTPKMLSGAGNKNWRSNKSIYTDASSEPLTANNNELIF